MARFKRGDICMRVADPRGPWCRILGGPTTLLGVNHYSIEWIGVTKIGVGSTFQFPAVIQEQILTMATGYNPMVDTAPSADCPNCGIEDMLFYFDDYICAWCREMLEAE